MIATGKNYKKISILLADDRPHNVRGLLEGLTAFGLLPKELATKLNLDQLDSKTLSEQNHQILHHDDALVCVDYATFIDDAIDKIKRTRESYDLIISDWYFGEYDSQYKESQIGGIWIILWAQKTNRWNSPVCRLYTGQTDPRRQGIDFKLAREFIKSKYQIDIKEIPKLTAPPREHLANGIREVANNLTNLVHTGDLVVVINYIHSKLSYSSFNNALEDNSFHLLRRDLLNLKEFELTLNNGQIIKLMHLFPTLLGRYLVENDKSEFALLEPQNLESILYGPRILKFNRREERDDKLIELKNLGVVCEPRKEHDGTGDPVYIIEIKSENYDNGILAEITKVFTKALDFTYKVQSFCLNTSGLAKWLHSQSIPLGNEVFDNIRTHSIIPEFKEIKSCFEKTPVELAASLPSLDKQILQMFERLEEKDLKKEREVSPKVIDERLSRLQTQALFEPQSRKMLVPIRHLFRIDLYSYLREILKLKPASGESFVIPDGYEDLDSRDFYWYCHAWLVREGLRIIANNMQGESKSFIILKPKNLTEQSVVRYKLLMRDSGEGLPRIARAFAPGHGYFSKVGSCLQGFCELVVRSKVNGLQAYEYNVFSGVDDVVCPNMKNTGTEFEITITQSRDR